MKYGITAGRSGGILRKGGALHRCRAGIPRMALVTLMLLLQAHASYGQGSPDSTHQITLLSSAFDDGRRALGAGVRAITSPLRWDGSDAARASILAIGAGSTVLLDDEASAAADRSRNAGNDRLQRIAVRYGDGVPLALFSVGLYGLGALTGDRWLRETGLLIGTAVLFSSAVVQLVKPIVGRARPYAGRGNAVFQPFTLSDTYHSRPSGHSAAAFAASAVLAERVDNPWASAGFYALATAGALSRIYSRDHWLSDVALSAAFAVPLSITLVREFEGGPGPGQKQCLQIHPLPGGIAVAWFF